MKPRERRVERVASLLPAPVDPLAAQLRAMSDEQFIAWYIAHLLSLDAAGRAEVEADERRPFAAVVEDAFAFRAEVLARRPAPKAEPAPSDVEWETIIAPVSDTGSPPSRITEDTSVLFPELPAR